jgi:hypothetical protein
MPAPFGCCPLKASQEDLYAVFMALAKGGCLKPYLQTGLNQN